MSWSLGLAEWDRLSWSCFTLGTCALYNEQISKIISIVTCFINNDSFLGKIMSMLSCKSRRFFCNYSQHLCLEGLFMDPENKIKHNSQILPAAVDTKHELK